MNLLLNFFFFFRPIMFIDLHWDIGGLNAPELFAASTTILLAIVFLYNVVVYKRLVVSVIDYFIIFYCLWCAFVYVLYIDKSSIADLAKFTLPFFTYIVMKNSIKSERQYLKLLKYMIIGFSVPVFISTFLILQGKGLDKVIYWTGLARFQGVYVNPHNLGHSMTLLIMVVVVFYCLNSRLSAFGEKKPGRVWTSFLMILVICSLYCLYKSYVRTTFLGLMIFFFVFLFKFNKKMLVIMTVVGTLLAIVFATVLSTIFFDVVDTVKGKRATERIASGRPYIWKHNLTEFGKLTLDRNLAGVGIGNRRTIFVIKDHVEDIWNSHNDWLEVMMQTGIIGLIIYSMMQFCFYRRIIKMRGVMKYVMLALFVTVCAMNFASNSYVVRFGIGQMYYMIISYIEIPKEEEDGESLAKAV